MVNHIITLMLLILLGNLMAHKKPDLPEKLCTVCNRTFKWRKKWEKEWENVKYCSERCRHNKIEL
jgi:hypothetical protein